MWTEDSPASSFPRESPGDEVIRAFGGRNRFVTVLVATTTATENTIVAFASIGWSVNFSGGVVENDGDLTYQPTAEAKTTTDTHYTLLLQDSIGQDAGDADLETYPPLFLVDEDDCDETANGEVVNELCLQWVGD